MRRLGEDGTSDADKSEEVGVKGEET